jgi:cell division septal protein FtsQ
VAFTHERTSHGPSRPGHGARRVRRNRRRTAPLWRRLPSREELVQTARQCRGWLQQGMPAVIATLGLVGLVAGTCVGHHFVTTSARFDVRAIEVVGNATVPAARLHALLGLDPAALAARPGPNIFHLDLARMADALETEPRVARAVVRRRLPSTLVIEIAENQPAALVEMDGMYLAEDSGRVFARALVERGDGEGLPVISGIAREDYSANSQAAEARIRRALEAVRAWTEHDDEAPARPALGEVHADVRRGITFFTHDTAMAVRVGHGSPEVLRARLRAFDLAWQSLSPEERARVRIVFADARKQPDRVTVSFADVLDENR